MDFFNRLELLGRVVISLACAAVVLGGTWTLIRALSGQPIDTFNNVSEPYKGYCKQSPGSPACHGGHAPGQFSK